MERTLGSPDMDAKEAIHRPGTLRSTDFYLYRFLQKGIHQNRILPSSHAAGDGSFLFLRAWDSENSKFRLGTPYLPNWKHLERGKVKEITLRADFNKGDEYLAGNTK